jgi:excinuclease ABC subunit B
LQSEYNAENGITPQTVRTAIASVLEEEVAAHQLAAEAAGNPTADYVTEEYLQELHAEMLAAADQLNFERAAELRDKIAQLKGEPTAPAPQVKKHRGRKAHRRGSPS